MLSDFLKVTKGDVISFVGAGGKTSLMLSLAAELSSRYRVIVTTTTKMATNEIPSNWKKLVFKHNYNYGILKKNMKTHGIVFVYCCSENGRLIGITPGIVKYLQKWFDIVLVEADGSRRLPLKIPKMHEPVIPDCSTKVVTIFGFDGLDRSADPSTCYNFEGMKEKIHGFVDGKIVTPNLLRRIFLEGGYLQKSIGKQLFVVINKADLNPIRAEIFARKMYAPVLSGIATSSVAEGWLRKIDNSERLVAGVILAAGLGKRFGGRKMAHLVDGKLMLECVLNNTKIPGLDKRILVISKDSEIFLKKIKKSSLRGFDIVKNPTPESGMSSSIKLGLRKASSSFCSAAMIFHGDMPFVTHRLVKRVIKAYRNSCAYVCRPIYNNIPGHPVIIDCELFSQIQKLKGDTGPKRILARYASYTFFIKTGEKTQTDIDTNPIRAIVSK